MHTPFQLYNFFKISIIEDNLSAVKTNLEKRLAPFKLTSSVLPEVNFKKVCAIREIPYNASKIKLMLYEPSTNPGVTVFFPNFSDGWHTAVFNYARINGKNAFQAGFSVDVSREFPAYYFNSFYWSNGAFNIRTVHTIKEDKLIFYVVGEPLAIEDTANYRKRRITDRLNNEIILSCLKKAGYDLVADDFFTSAKEVFFLTN